MNMKKMPVSAVWNPDCCIQCNICAYVCPTGALLPLIQTQEDSVGHTLALRENPEFRYSIAVSVENCTGCGLCVHECPAKGKALELKQDPEMKVPSDVSSVKIKFPRHSLKGSQFQPGSLSLQNACPGCAQAIYLKLLTQLFGQRMILAGAYGCSKTVKEFETHLGLCEETLSSSPIERIRAIYAAREQLKHHVRQLYKAVGISAQAWVEEPANAEKTKAIADILKSRCEKIADKNEHANYVMEHSALLQKPSVWVFGGDGIADADEQEKYAVLQSGLNVNLLLFETGDIATSNNIDFAKKIQDEGNTYVAQIAIGANYKQTLLAIEEAERHEGPSLIVAYAPCVGENIASDYVLEKMRAAVHNGEWKSFQFVPDEGEKVFRAAEAKTEYQPTFHEHDEKWAALSAEKNKHPMIEQDPKLRVKNFNEVYCSYSPARAIREAKRCLRCRERPCMVMGCPVHNRIPDFIEQVAKGNFEEAYKILSETTCLPAVCGRVCQQSKQCEGSCVRGKKGQPVAIGNLERFVADWHRAHAGEESKTPKTNGYQVAVIGSGPSGIACAGDLADLGYKVTIYEKEQKLGGVLTYGIPEFRLPKNIVSHEIEMLEGKGVQFQTGIKLGKELDANDLLQNKGYAAIYLANGAGIPLRMNIPGENSERVYSASEYLMKINIDRDSGSVEMEALSSVKRVAVVGGGNVAMDACRAAVRMGAETVYVLYRRSETEMPADRVELEEAREEGVQFRFLTNPIRILSNVNGVCGIECVSMELGAPDASGRRGVKPVDGTEFILDVDCVVMALGTSFDRSVANSVSGLAVTEKGGVIVGDDYMANLERFFAGGDTVTGPASVIRAMGAGKAAARSIHNYIQNKEK